METGILAAIISGSLIAGGTLTAAYLNIRASKSSISSSSNITTTSNHFLIGEWYGHYLIQRDNEDFFGQERITITQGSEENFEVHVESITLKKQYSGHAYEERNFLILHFKPTGQEENVLIRLELPIQGDDDRAMLGIWSAWDFDKYAAVGPFVLSKI